MPTYFSDDVECKKRLLKALTWRNDDQKDDDMKLSLFDVTVNKI